MPVTAKLSRKFYDTFGDDVANELVEWFNQVDAQYKSELKDLADVYYGRFRADLRAEIAELRTEMGEMRTELRAEIATVRSDLLKWMFVFWVGSVAATVGIVFAAVTLALR